MEKRSEGRQFINSVMYTVKRKRTLGIQTGVPLNERKDNWTQTGVSVCGSYNRLERKAKRMFTTYDNLRDNILCDMDTTFEWLKKERLIISLSF